MTDIDELQEERRLCSICDDPMIVGQAFHGISQVHWDCAQQAPAETPTGVLFVHAATGAAGAMGESRSLRPQPRMPERDRPPQMFASPQWTRTHARLSLGSGRRFGEPRRMAEPASGWSAHSASRS